MNKMVTMRIWKNLDTNVKIKANDPMVKEVDEFIFTVAHEMIQYLIYY